jgi:hypothetical protein
MSHMSMPSSSPAHCPECGAELSGGQGMCWLCQRKRCAEDVNNPYASPQPTENIDWQFSIATLFLVTTLIAVCLGLFQLAPGLGILLGVFAAPALWRTAIDVAKHKQRGFPLGAVGKVASFLVSLVLVVTVTVAATTAAFTVCAVGVTGTAALGQEASGLLLFIAPAGLATGLMVFLWLFWLTGPVGLRWEELWRRRR